MDWQIVDVAKPARQRAFNFQLRTVQFNQPLGGFDSIDVRQARDHAAKNVFRGRRTAIVFAKIARIVVNDLEIAISVRTCRMPSAFWAT
jgi:hypothetical protein